MNNAENTAKNPDNGKHPSPRETDIHFTPHDLSEHIKKELTP